MPAGSGPDYGRPVLVIQSDDFNRSRIRTIVALAIMTDLNLAAAPGSVRLSPRRTGLPKQSVVNVSQIITLDRRFLSERVGPISESVLTQFETGLRPVPGFRR